MMTTCPLPSKFIKKRRGGQAFINDRGGRGKNERKSRAEYDKKASSKGVTEVENHYKKDIKKIFYRKCSYWGGGGEQNFV